MGHGFLGGRTAGGEEGVDRQQEGKRENRAVLTEEDGHDLNGSTDVCDEMLQLLTLHNSPCTLFVV